MGMFSSDEQSSPYDLQRIEELEEELHKLRKKTMEKNIMLLTDSYKQSHYKQYPPNTEYVYSYFESRGGDFKDVVFFGLQYYIKEYLEGEVVTTEKIDAAEKLVNAHMGPGTFNREGWEYIRDNHKGRLPVTIKAVPEGTVVPGKNVMMTVVNTDPKCFWLTNFLETLLVQVWYGCTVATQSRQMKKVIKTYLGVTSDLPEDEQGLEFKLHDFGFRGVSSVETAGLGGCAHLVNFLGTDTMAALQVAQEYYGVDEAAGFSIPASEHSTITSWGRAGEEAAMENMLDQYPTGLVACVSDSYDIFEACSGIWGKKLREKILKRDGVLVVRPDSGDPPIIVVDVLDALWEAFGGSVNSVGFRVLDPHVRVIQGDGIDFEMLLNILEAMTKAGYSTENIAFGSGGGLLQKLNRDTLKFAFKCSAIRVGGVWRDVYKDPITDPGKISKQGVLQLVREEGAHGSYLTTKSKDANEFDLTETEDLLRYVFHNGDIVMENNLEQIRERAALHPRELSQAV